MGNMLFATSRLKTFSVYEKEVEIPPKQKYPIYHARDLDHYFKLCSVRRDQKALDLLH